MRVKKDLLNLQKSVKRIAAASGAFQFDDDTENLFPELPLIEDMEDDASGAVDILPRKTLRNRQYLQEPLKVRPEYQGDFLDKLRQEVYKNRSAECLLDFDMPSDLLKYIPTPMPRDLQDEFYDINRPGEGAGYKDLKEYYDRGWDDSDAPEMSEDKVLRERNWTPNKKPIDSPVKMHLFHEATEGIVNAYLNTKYRIQAVVAKFLMSFYPQEIEINLEDHAEYLKEAKLLRDLEKSQIYTKTHGWGKPGFGAKVTSRLIKSEPGIGRWTFLTTSGKGVHTTVFKFIPEKGIMDLNKLHVRVSCTCQSWLFWGAQFHAMTQDYIYISPDMPLRLKFSPPGTRDPEGKFLVCKHVLACVPIVRTKKIESMEPKKLEKLRQPPAVEVEKDFKEPIHIPEELKNVARRQDIVEIARKWNRMTEKDRRNFIMGLDSPRAVSYMAHRFPATSAKFVIEKLKDMIVKDRVPSNRVLARRLLRNIVG